VNVSVRRALLSVSDKTGLIELAQALARRQVEILSTGGSAQLIAAQGIAVTDVASYTGFPEIMDGRVKTLHPKIHGGLLGRRGIDEAVMAENDIAPIDLVVVNLYPFGAVSARADAPYALAIANIDIGGPAMVRAAAKNHERVAVVVDPNDYRALLEELAREDGATTFATRAQLAAKAFATPPSTMRSSRNTCAPGILIRARISRRSSTSCSSACKTCATGKTPSACGLLPRDRRKRRHDCERAHRAGKGVVV